MTYPPTYQLTEIGDGVASIHITTDDVPYMRVEDLVSLRRVVGELEGSDRYGALILEGGTPHFCVGATRETLLDPAAPDHIQALVGELARLVLAIPVPTVAAMAGHAIGGGLMFGLWCDLQVLARESLYAANFVRLGFTPGMGSTVLLPELLGPTLARELLFTGRNVTGAELAAWAPGLAHAVVPRASVREQAIALAEDVARSPRAAVRLFKAHTSARRRAALDLALIEERRMHGEVFDRDETRAAIAQNYAEGSP